MAEKVAVCAIFKNEAAFIREWIAYHLVLGVDHFFLYDNGSTDAGVSNLGNLEDRLTITPWPARPGQLSAYKHFISQRPPEFDWIAFIDLDEFLCPLNTDSLPEALGRYQDYSLVLVNWLMFGPNRDGGVHERRPTGLVIEEYTRHLPRRDPFNKAVKSIARSRDITGCDGVHIVTTSGKTCNALGQPIAATPVQSPPCHEVLRLNHYYTRSHEDWVLKLARMRADVPDDPERQRRLPEWFAHFVQHSTLEDRSITRFARPVRQLLSMSL